MENITIIQYLNILIFFAIISCVSLMSPGWLSTLSTFCSLDKISVLLRCYVVIILAWARIGGGGGEGVSNILTLRGKNALSGRDLYDGFEKRCIPRAKWVIHAHYPRKSEMRVVRSILSKNSGLVNIKLISNYLSRGFRLLADLEISL